MTESDTTLQDVIPDWDLYLRLPFWNQHEASSLLNSCNPSLEYLQKNDPAKYKPYEQLLRASVDIGVVIYRSWKIGDLKEASVEPSQKEASNTKPNFPIMCIST